MATGEAELSAGGAVDAGRTEVDSGEAARPVAARAGVVGVQVGTGIVGGTGG
jgi:hypothetical protein